MIKDADVAYINGNGKWVHGAAAITHRLFEKHPVIRISEEEKAEYERLIRELGYWVD